MPFNATAMRQRTKRVTATFDGQAFDVWYRPGAITPRAYQQLEASGDNIATLVDALVIFVSEWDIVDEHGQRISPTAEVMLDYPAPLLSAVMEAITADLTPAANDSSPTPLTALQ